MFNFQLPSLELASAEPPEIKLADTSWHLRRNRKRVQQVYGCARTKVTLKSGRACTRAFLLSKEMGPNNQDVLAPRGQFSLPVNQWFGKGCFTGKRLFTGKFTEVMLRFLNPTHFSGGSVQPTIYYQNLIILLDICWVICRQSHGLMTFGEI